MLTALLPFPFLPPLPKPPTLKCMNKQNIAYATTAPTPISMPHHTSATAPSIHHAILVISATTKKPGRPTNSCVGTTELYTFCFPNTAAVEPYVHMDLPFYRINQCALCLLITSTNTSTTANL